MRRSSFLAVLLTLAVQAGPVGAQTAETGDLGVYFDPAGTLTSASVTAFVPFSYYVIATAPPGGVLAYEFKVEHDPRVTITETIVHPPEAFDVGFDADSSTTNFIVSTDGACLEGSQIVLVEFEAQILAPESDLTFCLQPATPSSFDPPSPGYLDCATSDIQTFGFAYEGCAVANPLDLEAPVANEERSWSALKSSYGR